MKRAALALAALTLLMLMPGASAQSWEPAWEADLGPGYITTSPLVDDEHVYVRTSGFGRAMNDLKCWRFPTTVNSVGPTAAKPPPNTTWPHWSWWRPVQALRDVAHPAFGGMGGRCLHGAASLERHRELAG